MTDSYMAKVLRRAEERLRWKEGATTADHLGLFQRFRRAEEFRLQMLHRAGTAGLVIARDRATMMDVLIQHCWRIAHNALAAARVERTPLALLATGGYGRGELNPHSDVDILFLAEDLRAPYVQAICQDLLYMLWDIGLKVGHAARTPADCVRMAAGDMRLKTSLIDSRLIIGDEALWGRFLPILEKGAIERGVEEYVRGRMLDREERHERFGRSVFMQEPHLKGGRGGLRDLQNLVWMVRVKYGARSLEEMVEQRYLDAQEAKLLGKAKEFLFRVRNELHYSAGRANDVLFLRFQPEIARALGWVQHRSSLLRATEAIMREYYMHARNIALVTDELAERLAFREARKVSEGRSFWALLTTPFARPELIDGFRLQGGALFPESDAADPFTAEPLRLLRVFRIAQERDAAISPELRKLIRARLILISRHLQSSRRAAAIFMSILATRGSVGRTLRAMHETGVLGRYLPEFGRLTCLVQHEFFHRYTADEHTLVALETLDGLFHDQAPGPLLGRFRDVLLGLAEPELLALALLFHDTGRGLHARLHSPASVRLTNRALARMRLPPQARQAVHDLVREHTTMAKVSQRRDLNDPRTVRDFLQAVGTESTLNMLLLLTYADTVATGTGFWTEWRAALLWELFSRALHQLRGEVEREMTSARLAEIRERLAARLPRGVTAAGLDRHLALTPWRYFEVTDPELLRLHLQMAAASEAGLEEPVVRWLVREDAGFAEVAVCTGDRPGLFSLIAGSLAAAGLNILGAQIFTRGDGRVVDTFRVVDLRGSAQVGKALRDQFDSILSRVLAGRLDIEQACAGALAAPPPRSGLGSAFAAPRVTVANDASENRTLIEVQMADRPGLLYQITSCLAAEGINIDLAKVATNGGVVVDAFYVTDREGRKLGAEPASDLGLRLQRRLADRVDAAGAARAAPMAGQRIHG